MYRNLLLKIEYDGSDFAGWQIQPDKKTVQGELSRALQKITGQPVKVEGTSRTDAGVHALGQQATVKGDFGIPLDKLATVINRLLPDSVKVTEVLEKEEDFHARFSSRGKEYIYRIKNTAEKDVFNRNYYCFIEKSLDEALMQKAAAYYVGTHDFKAFMAMGSTPQKTTVRTIYHVSVVRSKDLIEFTVRGDGFLYNMVRIMAGTLIEAGLGRLQPEAVRALVEGGSRAEAGRTAPARGLYLNRVFYDDIPEE